MADKQFLQQWADEFTRATPPREAEMPPCTDGCCKVVEPDLDPVLFN